MRLRGLLIRAVPAAVKPALKRFRNLCATAPAYLYDLARYLRSSTTVFRAHDAEQLGALLTMDYHRLEKGMSLPSPRRGFGKDVVARILANLQIYRLSVGETGLVATVGKVLADYRAFSGDETPYKQAIDAVIASVPDAATEGGLLHQTKAEFVDVSSPSAFLNSRRSVRHFTGAPIDRDTIKRVVEVAQRAPSVCNRQSARVYAATGPEQIGEVLSHQNGNRGFGHTLGAVFIVAADNRTFCTLGERNQMWVDGGIFAMSLVLALHAEGLGACMLNWSVEPRADRRLRQTIGIDESHSVITLIGAGHLPETFAVAASPRRQASDILFWIG